MRTSHKPVPAKTLFSRTAAPLYLPKLDEHLSGIAAPCFSDFPQAQPPRSGKGKGKGKAASALLGHNMFPPLDMLSASGISIDDLEHNAARPPAWKDRNTIFGVIVSAFLGVTVRSRANRASLVLMQDEGFKCCREALQSAGNLRHGTSFCTCAQCCRSAHCPFLSAL